MGSATGSRLTPPEPRRSSDRQAIVAVGSTFWVNGVVFSSLLPRYPQIIEAVGAAEAAFGLALASGGLGGLLGATAAPLLARRFGLVPTVIGAGALVIAGGAAVPWAGTVTALALLFGALGVADALHDVTMNEAALGEQTRRSRSVMGRLHGLWSLGAAMATAVGAAMAALAVPVSLHMAGVAVVAAAAQAHAAKHLRERPPVAPVAGADAVVALPDLDRPEGAALRVALRVRVATVGLVGAAVVGVMAAEQSLVDWSALVVQRGLGASAGVAGLAPLVVAGSILLGRVGADAAIDRLGARGVARAGGALAAVAGLSGFAAVLADLPPLPVLACMAVAGVAVSPVFPLLFGAGDEVASRLGTRPGTGTSIIGTLPRLAGMVLPAGIGLAAESAGLSVVLAVVAAGGVLLLVSLPRLLPGGRAEAATP